MWTANSSGAKKLISVRKVAALLRISTSGYYQRLKVDRYRRHGVHHSDAELLCHVRSVISRCGKQVPGVMRLYLALRQQGLSVGFKRLRRLLRSNGIFHRYHRKYVATTDSNHNPVRLPNLIDRRFNRHAINQAWCGDITYIPTDEGWLFMTSVLDLASCCLASYSFDSTMKRSLVVDALRMAIANEHPAPGLIFHSDQGSQYCSHVFQEFLLRQGISGSMSERGQCWDTAPAEAFLGNPEAGNANVTRMLQQPKGGAGYCDSLDILLQWNSAPFTVGDAIPLSIQIKVSGLVIRAFLSRFEISRPRPSSRLRHGSKNQHASIRTHVLKILCMRLTAI